MNELPTIIEPVQKQTKSNAPRKEVEVRTVKIPVFDNPFDGYFSNRIDMTLSTDQAKTLKSIMFGLQSKYTKLANGKEIANGQDVLKWILENVG